MKIHGVTLPKLIEPSGDCIVNKHGPQKQFVKGVRVIGRESQRTPKHHGLVAADRMRRIKAVVNQLVQVNESVFSVGQQHADILTRVASRLVADGPETPCGLCPSRWGSQPEFFGGVGIGFND